MSETDGEHHFETGQQLESSHPKRAAKAFAAAIERDPGHEGAWSGLERVLLQMGDLDRLAGLKERLERGGVAADRLDGLARRIRESGEHESARAFLDALRTRPDDPAIRSQIGRFLARGGAESADVADLEGALTTLPLPTHIRIETASVCNLRCQHCTTGVAYKSTDRRVMSMETFERVLEQVRALETLRTAIMYLGGEPLLNKHHATMCRRVKAETQIATVKFVTNAMLLDDEWCDEIAEANVDGIHISVDGRSPEENDRIRRGASYDRVRANVHRLADRLRQAGCRTRITIGNTVFRRPDDLVKPTPPEFLVRDFPGLKIVSGYAMVWPGMTAQETSLDDLRVYQEKPRGFCDHPFYDIAIRANGDVIMCCYDISGQHVMGNVMRDDLLTLYQSEAYAQIRRAMLHHDKAAVPPICQRCVNFTGDRFIQNPMRE
ncbi:MAG TPA: radical SAM protein [Vicinamibacterales bacterium]|nr:radical SAM protein [Vicinamibacterales bacterium]